MYEKLLENCTLCPRECKVNRLEGMRGYCGMDSRIRAARAALHMWEEPCISGKKAPELYFFPAADCAAVSARTGILPLGTAEKRLRCSGLQIFFWSWSKRGRRI